VGWVEHTVRYYDDERVGLVAGFTLLEGRGWFAGIQAMDWLALFTVAAGAINAGIPLTAVGTNLTVRRRAYEEVGGFRGIPFSVTEDYALFRAIAGSGRWRARFPLDQRALVDSLPCGSWKELYRQKKRWFLGGRGMDARSLGMFAGIYLFHLAIPLAFTTGYVVPGLLAVCAKSLSDFGLAITPVVRFRAYRLLIFFPLFEVFFYSYVLLFPVLVLFGGKVIWKERAFRH
jgi:cellulose synthase/poly-beta-1,6-N-acetylglucosamine synthase-like glycosyltransferase